jgi:hypothetical protein
MLMVWNSLLIAIFAIWAFLSAASQFKVRWIRSLQTRDVFHLIPNWRFFAPVPARRDYHLEYRTKKGSRNITRWKRIDLKYNRGRWCAVWNPNKRFRKSFNTQVRRLTRILSTGGRVAASHSLAYLTLLSYLQHMVDAQPNSVLQYRIVTCQDFAPKPILKLVFTSDWHALDHQPMSAP